MTPENDTTTTAAPAAFVPDCYVLHRFGHSIEYWPAQVVKVGKRTTTARTERGVEMVFNGLPSSPHAIDERGGTRYRCDMLSFKVEECQRQIAEQALQKSYSAACLNALALLEGQRCGDRRFRGTPERLAKMQQVVALLQEVKALE